MAKEKIHKGEKRVAELTPMMQQYIETKKQYQDCILFYRLGDFYEMFFEDALTAVSYTHLDVYKRQEVRRTKFQIPLQRIL